MKILKKLVFLFSPLAFPMFLLSETQVDPALAPWPGVWSIIEDQSGESAAAQGLTPTVEIRLTADSKGLEISRKNAQQPEVKETLIPDGSKRPFQSDNCAGWQTSKLETGAIVTSSEMSCKDRGIFTTSSIRMIVAGNQMLDILGVKVAGQTRIAIRQLQFEHELGPSGDSVTRLAAAAARSAASAPWSISSLIQLSKEVDTTVLQAALVERDALTGLNAKSLKELKSAGVPVEIIDLVVALAYPDRFDIKRNGQVTLRPSFGGSRAGAAAVYAPIPGPYSGPVCYDPYGVPLPPQYCWSYYSPFWWDYPVYIGGTRDERKDDNARLSAARGYVQIEPRETGRHAKPRGSISSSSVSSVISVQRPAASGQTAVDSSSSTSSSSRSSSNESSGAPSSSSSSGSSSSGGSSGPSASPRGYSSGGSSSGSHATPKDKD